MTAGRSWPVAEMVNLNPCRNYRTWWTGMSAGQHRTCAAGAKCCAEAGWPYFLWETCSDSSSLFKLLQILQGFAEYQCLKSKFFRLMLAGQVKHFLALHLSLPQICLFMSFTCVFCVQNSVEALLFLRWWWIHRGWFSPAARPLHLGEKHRKPGEDPARHQRRAPVGCCCKETKLLSTHFKLNLDTLCFTIKTFTHLTFDLCPVASCPSYHCLHLQWSGVHLGSEPSGELLITNDLASRTKLLQKIRHNYQMSWCKMVSRCDLCVTVWFVCRKTGVLLLQTSKSWMRMWSMRSENLNLTSKTKTRVNRSRQVDTHTHTHTHINTQWHSYKYSIPTD